MRRRQRSLVSATVIALALGGLMTPAGADEVTDDDIAAARQAESNTSASIAATEARLAELSAEANELQVAAARAEAELAAAEDELSAAISDAMDAQDAANAAQHEVEEARKELSAVSTTIYRNGAASVTGSYYILGADSMKEASARSDAFRLLNSKTNRDLERLEAAQTVADSLQARADEKAAEQAEVAEKVQESAATARESAALAEVQVAAIASERDQLITQLATQKGVTEELVREQQDQREEAARKAAEEQAAALRAQAAAREAEQAEASRLAAEDAAARQAAADAAARKAAEEESRRAAEEAARRAAAQQQASTQQSSPAPATGSTGSSGGSAPVVSAPAPVSSGSSSTRSQIVAYARQFVGVPYVWGGYTPAGWDCVGFTYYVYKHFGYTTVRRTGSYVSQYWGGYTIVPASERLPGDLMWWPGHVGIYTGNGMHIAAWNPSMGTQERAVWGSPVYIRIVK